MSAVFFIVICTTKRQEALTKPLFSLVKWQFPTINSISSHLQLLESKNVQVQYKQSLGIRNEFVLQ